jgi:hypothetical protein
MKIESSLRDILTKDIEFATDRMIAETSPDRKLYYFSAIYGMTNRILNINYDPHLAFIDFVMTAVYNLMAPNILASRAGQVSWTVPADFWERLARFTLELNQNIRDDREVFGTLQKIANLAYVTTGNGYYLLQKGSMPLPD